MFCTAHRAPRPAAIIADLPKAADRRVTATSPAPRGQIFTDWASI